jgi:hypothetical protein
VSFQKTSFWDHRARTRSPEPAVPLLPADPPDPRLGVRRYPLRPKLLLHRCPLRHRPRRPHPKLPPYHRVHRLRPRRCRPRRLIRRNRRAPEVPLPPAPPPPEPEVAPPAPDVAPPAPPRPKSRRLAPPPPEAPPPPASRTSGALPSACEQSITMRAQNAAHAKSKRTRRTMDLLPKVAIALQRARVFTKSRRTDVRFPAVRYVQPRRARNPPRRVIGEPRPESRHSCRFRSPMDAAPIPSCRSRRLFTAAAGMLGMLLACSAHATTYTSRPTGAMPTRVRRHPPSRRLPRGSRPSAPGTPFTSAGGPISLRPAKRRAPAPALPSMECFSTKAVQQAIASTIGATPGKCRSSISPASRTVVASPDCTSRAAFCT